MTASYPSREVSLCQTRSVGPPTTSSIAYFTSSSQLEPGKTQTAKRGTLVLHLHLEDLEHRVREHARGDLPGEAMGFILGAHLEGELEEFPLANGGDTSVADLFQDVSDGLPLRVVDRFLEPDDDVCLHAFNNVIRTPGGRWCRGAPSAARDRRLDRAPPRLAISGLRGRSREARGEFPSSAKRPWRFSAPGDRPPRAGAPFSQAAAAPVH